MSAPVRLPCGCWALVLNEASSEYIIEAEAFLCREKPRHRVHTIVVWKTGPTDGRTT